MKEGLDCRTAALDLLRRGWPAGEDPHFDPDHALMLCRDANFAPGLIFLYESLRLFREVLQVTTVLQLWDLLVLATYPMTLKTCINYTRMAVNVRAVALAHNEDSRG